MTRKRFQKKILATLFGLLLIPQGMWAQDVEYYKYNTTNNKYEKMIVEAGNYTANPTSIDWYSEYDPDYGDIVRTIVIRDGLQTYTDRIIVRGKVDLILCDGATLEAMKGIEVTEDATLTIYAQENGTGTLEAQGYSEDTSTGMGTGNFYGAAIGGSIDTNLSQSNLTACGQIVIHGGQIIANSSGIDYAAGIGGCASRGAIELTIYGGKIVAMGGIYGAGIGGGGKHNYPMGGFGVSTDGGDVNIFGGEVTATGGAGDGTYGAAMGIGRGSVSKGEASGPDQGALLLGTGVTCYGNNTSSNPTGNAVSGYIDNVTTRYRYMKTVCLYDLWIGGTQVTSGNANAIHSAIPSYITVSEGGSVSFDGNSTLTLNNATLTKDVEWRGATDLIIRIKGNNTIKSDTKCIQYTGGLSNPPSISFERGDANNECSLTLTCGNDFLYRFSNVDNPGLTGVSWYNGKMLNGTTVAEEIRNILITTRTSLFAEGSGTSADPYLISTTEDLKDLSFYVGKGFLSSGYYVALKNDIDCSGLTGFKPIGGETYFPFMGTFDGRGFIISGLTYNPKKVEEYVGLFGEAGGEGINDKYPAAISNVILEDCYFGRGHLNGGIAAYLYMGTIDQCTVQNCTINSEDISYSDYLKTVYSGGITGLLRPSVAGTMSNCTVINSTVYASNTMEGDEYGASAGAITAYWASQDAVDNNYYDYDVTVSTKQGVADVVVKSGYDMRGVGGGLDITGGAQLYVKELTYEGLSADKGDVIQFSNGYDNNDKYYVPSKDVTVTVTPRDNYVITAVSLVYTPKGETEKEVPLNNVSKTGGYQYTFSMPDADAKFKATIIELVNYDLWIGGNRVTSVNAGNFFNDNGNTVSFSPATATTPNTLKLKGADISGNIVSNLDNLTIELTGTNSILKADTGTVIRSDNASAILTITKTGTAASLTLTNNNQNYASSSPSIISGFSSIDYTGLYLNSPAPTKYVRTAIPNAELNSLVNSIDNLCIHSATFTTTETYPLWINDIQFTVENASNIASVGTGAAAGIGISANVADNPYSVKYANNVLEFDNVILDAQSNDFAIVSGLSDLTVKFKGYNYFKGKNTYFTSSNNGKLTFTTDEENAEIAMENHVSFEGFATIDYSKVYLNPIKGLATIGALKAPTMSGMSVTGGQQVTFMSNTVPNGVSFYYTIDYADETADVDETQITMSDNGNGISGTMVLSGPGVVTAYAKFTYTGGAATVTKGNTKTGKYFSFAKSEISATYQPTINAPSIVPTLPSGVTVTYGYSADAIPVNSINASTGVITINGVTTTPDNFIATFSGLGNVDYQLLNSLYGQTDFSLGSFKLTVNPKALTDDMVTLSATSLTYNGKLQKPTVTVKDGNTVLKENTDYTVTNDGGTNVNDYNVTVEGKGNYSGKIVKTFSIKKAGATLSFSAPTLSAKIGEWFSLPKLTTSPENLTVSYTSSDEKVATVNPTSGALTLVAEGQTTITATYGGSANYLSATASYVLTVEAADPVVLDPIVKEEEHTMTPDDFLNPDGTDCNLSNVVINSILFTLKNTDSETGDGLDSSDNSVVINTTTKLSDLMTLLRNNVEPGSDDFAASFTGLTFILPPGEGYIMVESQESNGCKLMVKVGADNPLAIYLPERGQYNIPYSSKTETYVYMWNGGPDAEATSRVKAIFKGKKVMGNVKIFKVSYSKSASSSGVVIGDVNGDRKVDAKDVAIIRQFIMGYEVDGFSKNEADVNYDGVINVADIVKLIQYVSSDN